ncbi:MULTISPECIES: EAL and HDOD domain-containing protein [unclassified Massilia]|uniref:EAL and HDOD domain-containing protein n=1 Tax=unclassified Massilia TaxID=2609279 RepID=UPI0017869001|nr:MULTISPECIES: HDOD domain-containing protein [unclassified Massilia]MBD8529662.1 HDOD domain-containing protein [Massilia sp. CFBP 13647]MBD8673251.1 HDOD domain-containing protein [Massilia sp. CFBP 13721]
MPLPPPPLPTAPPAPAPAPLRREEVVDRHNRLYGYRFSLARGGDETLLFEALAAEDVAGFATRRMAVVPVTPAGAGSPLLRKCAGAHTVFVLDAAALAGQDGVAHLRALKRDGARCGLRGLSAQANRAALLAACDVLFLDLAGIDLADVHDLVEKLRSNHPHLELAVESVTGWEEQRMCLTWGVDYCLGSFLFKPDLADEDGSLDQSRVTALKLLNLLRSDADLAQLAEVAKQDPAITLQLLKWANASAHARATAVTGLGQAILVLGRNVVYRWLAVAIFKLGRQRERDAALLEVALRRARFMELVDPALTTVERDELFLAGILSLFDVMLGMPMARLLDHMHLSQDIHDVLLRSAGKYGPYLRLALVVEGGDSLRAAALAAAIGIDPDDIGPAQAAAFAWMRESLR